MLAIFKLTYILNYSLDLNKKTKTILLPMSFTCILHCPEFVILNANLYTSTCYINMQDGLTNNELNPVRLPVRAIALKWIDRYASDFADRIIFITVIFC